MTEIKFETLSGIFDILDFKDLLMAASKLGIDAISIDGAPINNENVSRITTDGIEQTLERASPEVTRKSVFAVDFDYAEAWNALSQGIRDTIMDEYNAKYHEKQEDYRVFINETYLMTGEGHFLHWCPENYYDDVAIADCVAIAVFSPKTPSYTLLSWVNDGWVKKNKSKGKRGKKK